MGAHGDCHERHSGPGDALSPSVEALSIPLVARADKHGTASSAIFRGREGRRSFDSRIAAGHKPAEASASRAAPRRIAVLP